MADLPITFSGSMVRAILREIEQPGTGKTQTRRVVMDAEAIGKGPWTGPARFNERADSWQVRLAQFNVWERVPVRYRVGDRLYVREHWRTFSTLDDVSPRDLLNDRPGATIAYLADNSGAFYSKPPDEGWHWVQQGIDFAASGRFRQAMHMPKWASRITLIVTDVRVERLQDIGTADVIAEGITEIGQGYGLPDEEWLGSPEAAFRRLWNSVNGDGAWDANPWVVAYTFRPVLGNIDQIGKAEHA